jgi:hypothetical protein
MKDMEVKKLVDQGRVLKDKIDALELEHEGVKKKLREVAKSRKVGYLIGNKHFARISPQTTTTCNSEKAYDLFEDLDRREEFFECTKMLVTDTKAKLGESVFESISITKSESYKKVSFLLKTPKKYLEK